MILSFKPHFVQPILEGTKIHSLRLDPTDRWFASREIHFATGVRSDKYKCFKHDYCRRTQRVYMWLTDLAKLKIEVDGKTLSNETVEVFVKNDGFKNQAEFINWFWTKGDEGVLSLKLIHWTNFKY